MKKKNALTNLKLRTGVFALLSVFGLALSLYAIKNIVFILSVGWAFPEPNISLNITLATLSIAAVVMLWFTWQNGKKFWEEWQGRSGSAILSETSGENYAHLTDEAESIESDFAESEEKSQKI